MLKLNSKQTKIETNFSNCSSSLLLPASPCYNLRICCTSYCTSFNHFILRWDVRFNSYLEICKAICIIRCSYQCTQFWASVEVCWGVEAPRLVWRPVDAPQLSAPPSYRNPEHFQTLYIQFFLDAKKEPLQNDFNINKYSAMMQLS